jgi:hypothetical protein
MASGGQEDVPAILAGAAAAAADVQAVAGESKSAAEGRVLRSGLQLTLAGKPPSRSGSEEPRSGRRTSGSAAAGAVGAASGGGGANSAAAAAVGAAAAVSAAEAALASAPGASAMGGAGPALPAAGRSVGASAAAFAPEPAHAVGGAGAASGFSDRELLMVLQRMQADNERRDRRDAEREERERERARHDAERDAERERRDAEREGEMQALHLELRRLHLASLSGQAAPVPEWLLNTRELLGLEMAQLDERIIKDLTKDGGLYNKPQRDVANALVALAQGVRVEGGVARSTDLAQLLLSILDHADKYVWLPDLQAQAPSALKEALRRTVMAALKSSDERLRAVADATAGDGDSGINVDERGGNRGFVTWLLLALRYNGVTLEDALAQARPQAWQLGGVGIDHIGEAIKTAAKVLRRALLTVKGVDLAERGAGVSVCRALMDVIPPKLADKAYKVMSAGGSKQTAAAAGAGQPRWIDRDLSELVELLHERLGDMYKAIGRGDTIIACDDFKSLSKAYHAYASRAAGGAGAAVGGAGAAPEGGGGSAWRAAAAAASGGGGGGEPGDGSARAQSRGRGMWRGSRGVRGGRGGGSMHPRSEVGERGPPGCWNCRATDHISADCPFACKYGGACTHPRCHLHGAGRPPVPPRK